jgi:hypothetical protein
MLEWNEASSGYEYVVLMPIDPSSSEHRNHDEDDDSLLWCCKNFKSDTWIVVIVRFQNRKSEQLSYSSTRGRHSRPQHGISKFRYGIHRVSVEIYFNTFSFITYNKLWIIYIIVSTALYIPVLFSFCNENQQSRTNNSMPRCESNPSCTCTTALKT